ncbi:MAG: pilus assembly protein TadG-related protein [Gemmatimonadetes bacterium]|nr:pilus assembly protein TadG-related protein [Gemmatimonadota bacterium]
MQTPLRTSFRRAREGVRGQRGAVTLTVALGMTLLLGSAAIAIDLGHLMAVRGESQRAADAAALAGASAYVESAAPNIDVAVDAWSKDVAHRNEVNKTPVTLLTPDIVGDAATERVTVEVVHTQARGNAIPTIFGGAVRIGGVDVVTRATAEASFASAVHCALPLFLVDRWQEMGGDPNRFDIGTDYFEAYDPAAPSVSATSYYSADVGLQLDIEPAGALASDLGNPMPTWYFPFAPGELPGGAGTYQLSIEGCLDPGRVYDWGDDAVSDPTPQALATNLSMQVLIDSDPSARWEPALSCVVDAADMGRGDPSKCRSSPRIRPALLIDPSTAPGSAQQPVTVSNLAGVFVENVLATQIQVRLMGYQGVTAARASGGGFAPPLVRTLRIIE